MSKPFYSVKPTGDVNVVFTPKPRPFNRSVSSEYIVKGRYSGVASEKRKQHLRNKRNWTALALGILPEIANIYDQTISQSSK